MNMEPGEDAVSDIKVFIQKFNVTHVKEHDHVKFNTNNHYLDNKEPQPPDYHERIARSNTKHWIDRFHAKEVDGVQHRDYHILTLDHQDLHWMAKALKIGAFSGEFSQLFQDELEWTVERHKASFPPGKWFVRTESHSLKTGMHRAGPYDNLTAVIESMCTTTQEHRCFDFDPEKGQENECRLYFLPWLQLDYHKEFRAFVHQNHITAISDQHLYSTNPWLNSLKEEQLCGLVREMVTWFHREVRERMAFLGDYVMDFTLLPPNADNDHELSFYFIEGNSFGKNYSSGSALFHWIQDDYVLHHWDSIEFRYCNS